MSDNCLCKNHCTDAGCCGLMLGVAHNLIPERSMGNNDSLTYHQTQLMKIMLKEKTEWLIQYKVGI